MRQTSVGTSAERVHFSFCTAARKSGGPGGVNQHLLGPVEHGRGDAHQQGQVVAHGGGHQMDVVHVPVPGLGLVLHVAQVVVVRARAAFGQPGGAAGGQDLADLARVGAGRIERRAPRWRRRRSSVCRSSYQRMSPAGFWSATWITFEPRMSGSHFRHQGGVVGLAVAVGQGPSPLGAVRLARWMISRAVWFTVSSTMTRPAFCRA